MKKLSTAEAITAIVGIIIIVLLVIVFIPKKSMPKVAAAGDTVSVNYIGTLQNGTKFDSSYDRGQPISFVLGAGQVIQGWDEGIVGMKVGDKKHLVISPEKGYGSQAVGPIPANSTLIFDIELVGIN